MTKHNVDELVKSICAEYKVVVIVDEDFPKDYGECYPDRDTIVLTKKFSSGKIKLAVFLHELGHIITMRRTGQRYLAASIFQEESSVWSIAQELHLQYTNKPFSKGQAKFMLHCLDTYSEHHYSFVKKYNKDPDRKHCSDEQMTLEEHKQLSIDSNEKDAKIIQNESSIIKFIL